jgi:GNAT superfamily N-acetyltransferase
LRSLIYKLRRSLRQDGVGTTIKLMPRRLWLRIHWRTRMIVLLKDLDAPAPPVRDTDLLVTEVEPRHLPALAELNKERGLPSADARFASDLDSGYGGFVAFRGERLVAFYWWVDRDAPAPESKSSIGAAIDELGLEIELEEGDVYGADLYVAENDRPGATAQRFLDRVEASLRERGYHRLWGYVQDDNRLARWTYSLRGYEPMWRVVHTETLMRRRSWTEPMSKER